MEKLKKISEELDNIGNELYRKYGTESYEIRCRLFDERKKIEDYILECESLNTPTSEEQLAALAVVKSVCVRCGKPIDNFDKDSNNCCDECWLSS